MKAKEIIHLNNDKRKELNPENLKYYEDMLVYIRLSYNKSQEETEEILLELLEHLLEAQKEGKSAKEVFGESPRLYADQIVGEIPKMVTKERLSFGASIILYFLGASALAAGVIKLVLYIIGKSSLTTDIYLGSVFLKTIISLPLAFLLLYVLLEYIRWSLFRNINKVVEFMIFWLFGLITIGFFFALVYFTPEFGPLWQWPFYGSLILGTLLFALGYGVSKIKN
mgnify:CR=1 FL=1